MQIFLHSVISRGKYMEKKDCLKHENRKEKLETDFCVCDGKKWKKNCFQRVFNFQIIKNSSKVCTITNHNINYFLFPFSPEQIA